MWWIGRVNNRKRWFEYWVQVEVVNNRKWWFEKWAQEVDGVETVSDRKVVQRHYEDDDTQKTPTSGKLLRRQRQNWDQRKTADFRLWWGFSPIYSRHQKKKQQRDWKQKDKRFKIDNFARKKDSSLLCPDFGQSRGAVDERLSHSAKIYPDFSTSTRQWT